MIAKKGFKAIDVDLIFGIPDQTPKDLQEDMIKAAEYGATQISTYPFIDFTFANSKQKPLNKGQKRILLDSIVKTSEEIGFTRTSVWTFAKKILLNILLLHEIIFWDMVPVQPLCLRIISA